MVERAEKSPVSPNGHPLSWLKKLWTSQQPGWTALRLLLLFCACSSLAIMLFEEKLIYFPERYPRGDWSPEDSLHGGNPEMARTDCYFETADGLRLHAWYCAPFGDEPSSATSVILLCHGNAGNISHRYDRIHRLVRLGFHVLALDYRGYGRSEGKPSEKGLYRDADAAWAFLTKTRGIQPAQIVIYGISLGGAPAIDLASRVDAAGLIAESTFSSIPDMAAATMPFIPRFLVRTRMDSVNKVGAIHCPKLFIHSPVDEVVPYRLGKRLYEAAAAPKQFYEVADAGHNDTYRIGGRPYFAAIQAFVAESRAAATVK